jgi:hypothetical protein
MGTLDRSRDFDRRFHPVRPEQQQRLDTRRRAFPNDDFPPIVVYDIGGAYFVSDGHHRVALVHERGILEVDAEVTRIQTRYELPPDGRYSSGDPHPAAPTVHGAKRTGQRSPACDYLNSRARKAIPSSSILSKSTATTCSGERIG